MCLWCRILLHNEQWDHSIKQFLWYHESCSVSLICFGQGEM
jgi:hypothetical protein